MIHGILVDDCERCSVALLFLVIGSLAFAIMSFRNNRWASGWSGAKRAVSGGEHPSHLNGSTGQSKQILLR